MKLEADQHPSQVRKRGRRERRRGRALGLLLVIVPLAGLIGFLVGSLRTESAGPAPAEPAASAVATPAGAPTLARRAVEQDAAGAGAVPDAAGLRSLAGVPSESAASEVAGAHPERRPEALQPGRWQDVMQRLQRGQDDATRLAAARELLDGEAPASLRMRALDVLAQLDPASVAGELERLAANATGDPRADAAVVMAIQTVGRSAESVSAGDLQTLFEGGSREVRLAAAAALAMRGDESLSLRFQEERRGDLSDGDPRVRTAAVRELSQLGCSTSLLLPLLADESGDVRLAALSAVQRSGDPAALDSIRALVDDPCEPVRRSAARMVDMMERRLEREQARGQGAGGLVPGLEPGGRR